MDLIQATLICRRSGWTLHGLYKELIGIRICEISCRCTSDGALCFVEFFERVRLLLTEGLKYGCDLWTGNGRVQNRNLIVFQFMLTFCILCYVLCRTVQHHLSDCNAQSKPAYSVLKV